MIAAPRIADLRSDHGSSLADEIAAVVNRHVDVSRESVEIVSALRDLSLRVEQLQDTVGTDLLWSLETTRQKLGGVSGEYVRQLGDAGELQRVYQGRRPFFVAASVRAYVDRLTDAP